MKAINGVDAGESAEMRRWRLARGAKSSGMRRIGGSHHLGVHAASWAARRDAARAAAAWRMAML